MNDLISRESVIAMLQKIENAVEDGDGFQFNEWIEYAKDIPSAEKTTLSEDKTTITDTDLISRQAVNKLRKYNLVGGVHTVSLDDINKLPSYNSIKTELNGDLISRQAVLDLLRIKHEPIKGYGIIEYINVNDIKKLPSAEKR